MTNNLPATTIEHRPHRVHIFNDPELTWFLRCFDCTLLLYSRYPDFLEEQMQEHIRITAPEVIIRAQD